MTTALTRLFLLVVILVLGGGANLIRAQEGFKGGPRPPNPEVRRPARAAGTRRANVKQTKPVVSDPIEVALERGNKLYDEALEATAPADPHYQNFQPAEEEYRKVLALNPNEARGYYGLGNVFTQQRYYANAEAAYKQALVLNPKYVEVYLGLGEVSRWHGSGEQQAIDYYKKAISIKPDFDQAYIALGWLYEYTKRQSEAIRWYQEAIRHKPDSGPAYYRLGSILDGLNREDEAIQQYKQAVRFHDADAYQTLTQMYIDLKRYSEGISIAKQWIRFKPNVFAYLDLGILYENLKRYPEAVAAYQQAVRLEPDMEDTHYMLGLAYLEVKNKTAAMKEYGELKKLKSSMADELLEEINKK